MIPGNEAGTIENVENEAKETPSIIGSLGTMN